MKSSNYSHANIYWVCVNGQASAKHFLALLCVALNNNPLGRYCNGVLRIFKPRVVNVGVSKSAKIETWVCLILEPGAASLHDGAPNLVRMVSWVFQNPDLPHTLLTPHLGELWAEGIACKAPGLCSCSSPPGLPPHSHPPFQAAPSGILRENELSPYLLLF